MANSSGMSRERIARIEGPHKVLVIGDSAVGKTSLILQYVAAKFDPNYKVTLGVDFALKVVERENEPRVRLQLWDIAGQERFGKLTRVYYRQAVACIIVFDLTRHQTFESVKEWKRDLDEKVQLPNGDPLPCLLLGNKCDIPVRQVTREEINELKEKLGFVGFSETSAMNNIKIDESMNLLIKKIISVVDDSSLPPSEEEIMKLQSSEQREDSFCCRP